MAAEDCITCLVYRGLSAKKLSVSGNYRVKDLRAALQAHPDFDDIGDDVILQVEDKEFQEYVDIEEDTVLENKSRIKVIDIPCKVAEPINLDERSATSGLEQAKSSSDVVSVAAVAAASPTLSPLATQSSNLPCSTKDPNFYRLPDVPTDIRARLADVTRGSISNKLRDRIIDWIYFDLCTYTMYPGTLYKTAAEELIKKYPALRDASAKGYFTWHMGIKNKAKNNRKRCGDGIPEVDAAKKKAKKQKEAKAAAASAQDTPRKAVCKRQVVAGLHFDRGEDEISQMGHVNFMHKEMKRTIIDQSKVKVSMDRTFVARRMFVEQERRLVSDILDQYPALGTEAEVRHEFFRLTSLQASEAMKEMIKKYGEKILALAAAKGRSNKTCLQQDDYQYPVEVLMSLPCLVRERTENFISQLDPEKTPVYPDVTYTGDHPATSSCGRMKFESLTLPALDITEAVELAFCAYWAFNTEYAPLVKNTFLLMEILFGLQPSMPSVTAVKAATAIRG